MKFCVFSLIIIQPVSSQSMLDFWHFFENRFITNCISSDTSTPQYNCSKDINATYGIDYMYNVMHYTHDQGFINTCVQINVPDVSIDVTQVESIILRLENSINTIIGYLRNESSWTSTQAYFPMRIFGIAKPNSTTILHNTYNIFEECPIECNRARYSDPGGDNYERFPSFSQCQNINFSHYDFTLNLDVPDVVPTGGRFHNTYPLNFFESDIGTITRIVYHEIGHSFGFPHTDDYGSNMSMNFQTIMGYSWQLPSNFYNTPSLSFYDQFLLRNIWNRTRLYWLPPVSPPSPPLPPISPPTPPSYPPPPLPPQSPPFPPLSPPSHPEPSPPPLPMKVSPTPMPPEPSPPPPPIPRPPLMSPEPSPPPPPIPRSPQPSPPSPSIPRSTQTLMSPVSPPMPPSTPILSNSPTNPSISPPHRSDASDSISSAAISKHNTKYFYTTFYSTVVCMVLLLRITF